MVEYLIQKNINGAIGAANKPRYVLEVCNFSEGTTIKESGNNEGGNNEMGFVKQKDRKCMSSHGNAKGV